MVPHLHYQIRYSKYWLAKITGNPHLPPRGRSRARCSAFDLLF